MPGGKCGEMKTTFIVSRLPSIAGSRSWSRGVYRTIRAGRAGRRIHARAGARQPAWLHARIGDRAEMAEPAQVPRSVGHVGRQRGRLAVALEALRVGRGRVADPALVGMDARMAGRGLHEPGVVVAGRALAPVLDRVRDHWDVLDAD